MESCMFLLLVLSVKISQCNQLLSIVGTQHVAKVQFCNCEEDFVTLLRFGLWGATPQRPELAFHIHFMRSLMHLQLEAHVSVKGFCAAYSFLNKENVLLTVRMKRFLHFRCSKRRAI